MAQTNPQDILDKIFSSDFFKNVDTAALIELYEISADLGLVILLEAIDRLPQVQVGQEISTIPPEGIIITSPGNYQFTNNITWNPLNEGSAIYIESENVVLDLGGYTLNAQYPNNLDVIPQYIGVRVNKSIGVNIQNGTISGMSYCGVFADSVINLLINNIIVTGLSFKNTVIKNITPSGFFIGNTVDFVVQSCIVQNLKTTSASCAGIQILKSSAGVVSSCLFNQFHNRDGSVQGLSYLLSSDILTNDCACTDFQSDFLGLTTTLGHTVIGYCPLFCINLLYNNCSSANMTGCCDDCHGMSVFLNAFVEVNNFSAKNIFDGVAPYRTGAKATGLEVYGIGVKINNCTVENIIASVPQNRQSAGFSAWGSAISFTNCSATNVLVTNGQGQPTIEVGYGTGYGWAPDPRQVFFQPADFVTYNNCSAINCQLGFDTFFHTNSVWENVTAPGCQLYVLISPEGTQRTLAMNKCSESPTGLPATVSVANPSQTIIIRNKQL